ncbi:MAG TPA: diguanylate cyclase, partial [Kofleriaceae bacterium]|nr:diguanylate cyclase [Kofleriaceae bacterium]
MSSRRVLFIDPDPTMDAASAAAVGRWLVAASRRGFAPDTVTAADALARLDRVSYGVVVLGLAQAGPGGGERLIETLYARHPEIMFVAIAEPRSAAGAATPGARPAAEARPELEIATLLVPPFSPDELALALDDAYQLFDRRRRHRATSLDRAQILLVEDNEGDADLVMDYLTEICGAIVTRAPRIEAAVQALAAHRFDFVISDLSLPDARGLDAVRRLQPLAPDTPLLVLTGLDDEVLALEAVKQGAQDYLVKGQIDAPSLRRTLSHARERKRTWNRLREQTRHDPLTGAANRAALRERIEAALAKVSRVGGAFAVMFIDLDRFKAINDTYGHDAGDLVLCEVIERLRQSVRASDMVARLGGDELAVVLDDLWPEARPLEVAERILAAVAQPITTGSRALAVTASIGLACYPDRAGTIGSSVDAILKAADAAMYRAKRGGRNNIQVDGAASEAEVAHRVLAGELRDAVEAGELVVRLQPQLAIDRAAAGVPAGVSDRPAQRVVAYVARAAWPRPGGGVITDAALQSLIDGAGCALEVGRWLIDRACGHLARWRAAGRPQLRVV